MDVALETLDEGDPKTAIDILRLVAPGLTDVQYVSAGQTDQNGSGRQLLDEPQARYVCETCGKECGSAGALGGHRRTHRD
jgi:hypothetical protein